MAISQKSSEEGRGLAPSASSWHPAGGKQSSLHASAKYCKIFYFPQARIDLMSFYGESVFIGAYLEGSNPEEMLFHSRASPRWDLSPATSPDRFRNSSSGTAFFFFSPSLKISSMPNLKISPISCKLLRFGEGQNGFLQGSIAGFLTDFPRDAPEIFQLLHMAL